MAQATKAPARERILTTARALFYSRGINATGIDLIVEQAHIAKASLYHHFPSKEQLVVAYLADLRTQFEAALDGEITKRGHDVAIPFNLLDSSLVSGEFFGCPFTNALTEMPNSAPVIDEVRKYRASMLEFFSLAADGDAAIAQNLMLIYDGLFTSCKLDPDRRRIRGARDLARRLAGHTAGQPGLARKPPAP
jgi:AcrR family transcriptional regulator